MNCIYFSGISNTHSFLSKLRETCPSGLTAPFKGENMMFFPEITLWFRAAVTVLHSLNGSRNVTFHTLLLLENSSVHVLTVLRYACVRVPFRRSWRFWTCESRGVMQLRSGCRDQNNEKDRPWTLHFVVSVPQGPEVTKFRFLTELCGFRVTVETYVTPNGVLQCKRSQRFGHTHCTPCTLLGVLRMVTPTHHVAAKLQCSTPNAAAVGEHTLNYRNCGEWKEEKQVLVRRLPLNAHSHEP